MGASEGKAGLTERQRKWFASVRASLERDTGRSLEHWVQIARAGPETTPRARSAWLRREHGLGTNRAAQVLAAAFPSATPGWDDPEALRAQLWSEPASREILDAVERTAADLPGLVIGQRKGYTSFSRAVQFAALRPLKGGGARLGPKLDLAVSARLSGPARKESWSERLTAVVDLAGAGEVDAELKALLAAAFERG